MKSLEQFNKDRQTYYERLEREARLPHYNNIACPKCGHELLDSDPESTLLSNPPQKNIHCAEDGCGFRGYRIA